MLIKQESLKIYIGWDSREEIAYDVCKYSILKHSTIPVTIQPLKLEDLYGVYNRKKDNLASTEFTYTRFLVPYLNGYSGWALFLDCDFLITCDIKELLQYCDDRYAIRCVKHPDYVPNRDIKMDNKTQTTYPRKNWSSFVLFNCEHTYNNILTPDFINNTEPKILHRFLWLTNNLIGDLPSQWNWIEDIYEVTQVPPKGIHYTAGGPWFENYQKVPYSDLWLKYKNETNIIRN